MLTTNTNPQPLVNQASLPFGSTHSENRAKEKLTVYDYRYNPGQWERDLIAFRQETGYYDAK